MKFFIVPFFLIFLLACKAMNINAILPDKTLKIGQNFEVELLNRGSSGLTLLSKLAGESIVKVEETKHEADYSGIGKPSKVTFSVTALKKGTTKVIFYETRVFDKDFVPLIIKEITVQVN